MAPAISCGCPTRRNGNFFCVNDWISGSASSMPAILVSIRPGAMQLTRMPCGPHSTARSRASCMSPALDNP
ncbi:hypothetical protein D3C72_2034660 [compost metagenome]